MKEKDAQRIFRGAWYAGQASAYTALREEISEGDSVQDVLLIIEGTLERIEEIGSQESDLYATIRMGMNDSRAASRRN